MILDQGPDGACTGFGLAAVVNYLNWYRKALSHWRANNISAPTELPDPEPLVSEWMLYNTARLYDEWEGEDYSGSSCRGAMKGWHKHGVCKRVMWPKSGPGTDADGTGWRQDAARLPLGAYYRINVQSIADMQAAIYEVGAVYCSAKVHSGWFFQEHDAAPDTQTYDLTTDGTAHQRHLPIIPLMPDTRGGHAFALVGYNARGFIVQNSWGPGWGTSWGTAGKKIANAAGGFALMTYEDWVLNAHDAWVATLAAPMMVETGTAVLATRTHQSLLEQAAQSRAETHLVSSAGDEAPKRWTDSKAKQHCIVMGNDGKLMRERIDVNSAREGLRKSMTELLEAHEECDDVVIFAHGGLNNMDAAFRRARVLGPWFKQNNILPIFIVWRTGFGETLANIGEDFLNRQFPSLERAEKSGLDKFFNRLADGLKQRTDRGFEAVAEKVLGKAVWSQMKQNAEAANQHDTARNLTGGMRELANFLRDYQKTNDDRLRLHLLGHSAGSIILGHFARDLTNFTNIASLGLLAPACTLKFANAIFRPLVKEGRLQPEKFFIANLNRENERSDRVGPYNKSLLYLVSRAFEVPRKTPLLGLDDSWILKCELESEQTKNPQVSAAFRDENDPLHQAMVLANLAPYYALTGTKELSDFGDMGNVKALANVETLDNPTPLRRIANRLSLNRITQKDGIHDVLKWRSFKAQSNFPYLLHTYPNAMVRRTESQRKKFEPIAHGNIDNDIYVMNWALTHMITENPVPATDLSED
ncbi:C1 family peptidase [Tropicibacter sp. R16_0]|uniref:C1 family peptidase n=1 Tax=Tropicibacter sp. R16_0 TaxID=2821102 RepID=UPI001ADBAEB7|nr:C1 family peptidase [Tropicibacter sp. R16_0]MBO9449927.1 C1 family peptidase [Tropicibacter sp. R16_0]